MLKYRQEKVVSKCRLGKPDKRQHNAKTAFYFYPAEKRIYEIMELMETIAYAVNSFGFPILCNVALFWYMITQRKIHREESAQMAETINNNTQAIIALAELIKEEKDDLK